MIPNFLPWDFEILNLKIIFKFFGTFHKKFDKPSKTKFLDLISSITARPALQESGLAE